MEKHSIIHEVGIAKFPSITIELEENFVTKIYFNNKNEDKNHNSSHKTSLETLVCSQIDEYFQGKRRNFSFAYKSSASDFENKVYKELMKIPYGETASYLQIAKRLGNPLLSRAVGRACNKNPLLILIPCHRVIASSGELRGYATGLEIKKELLLLENPSIALRSYNDDYKIINKKYIDLK